MNKEGGNTSDDKESKNDNAGDNNFFVHKDNCIEKGVWKSILGVGLIYNSGAGVPGIGIEVENGVGGGGEERQAPSLQPYGQKYFVFLLK